MRLYTDWLTSSGRSTRLMRTSTISSPSSSAWSLAATRSLSMISVRSPETTCRMVRLPNSSRRRLRITSPSRLFAWRMLPPAEV